MKMLGKLFILFAAALAVQAKHQRLAPSATVATHGEFPHQVSIQIDGRHFCGGALISKQHVLTAGHCVRDFILDPTPASIKGRRMVVEVGSTTIGSGTKHAVKRVSQIRQFKGDMQYDPVFMPNDIAVITLKTPVTESANVKTINLPASNSEIPVGSKVTISGFGSPQVNMASSSVLKKSPMTITSHQECNNYYTQQLQKRILTSHICAKQTVGHGTCQGDSGGPLIQGKTIVGVVSGGNGDCGSGYPDVYTKVSHFIPYINYELNYDSKKPNNGAGPALAVDIDESSSSVGQPGLPPGHFNPYPNLPGNVQLIDPNTGALLPPGTILIDPLTGLPIDPSEGFEYPQYPQTGLYPGLQFKKSEE